MAVGGTKKIGQDVKDTISNPGGACKALPYGFLLIPEILPRIITPNRNYERAQNLLRLA